GVGAVLSASIVLIVLATRFDDAWVVLPVMPAAAVVLLRLNRQYERERAALETDVPAAVGAPILRRHVVLVMVDRLDMAAARAIQYARTLTPNNFRQVHFTATTAPASPARATSRHVGMPGFPTALDSAPPR